MFTIDISEHKYTELNLQILIHYHITHSQIRRFKAFKSSKSGLLMNLKERFIPSDNTTY
jgi:hypothetical protein